MNRNAHPAPVRATSRINYRAGIRTDNPNRHVCGACGGAGVAPEPPAMPEPPRTVRIRDHASECTGSTEARAKQLMEHGKACVFVGAMVCLYALCRGVAWAFVWLDGL